MRKIERLEAKVIENLDILSGSVLMWHLKCGKNCVCNDAMGHVCHYLSFKKKGKTKNLYLSPGAVNEAKKMIERHKKIKALLLEIYSIRSKI